MNYFETSTDDSRQYRQSTSAALGAFTGTPVAGNLADAMRDGYVVVKKAGLVEEVEAPAVRFDHPFGGFAE